MSAPAEKPRKRRLVLCMGVYCNQGGRAEGLYQQVEAALGPRRPAWAAPDQPIRWEVATCLSMCGAGPNAVLYPEDESFNGLTPEKLAALLTRLQSGE